jgi:hypothetical protein
MGNKIKDLIRLLEVGPDMFYEHFQIKTQSTRIELQWINSNWRFCLIPYTNQWTIVKSPTDILGLDLNEFKEKATQFLLAEYYCYHNKIIENEFRKRKIEQVLGLDLCYESLRQMEKFKEELRKLLTVTPPDGLTLLK